MDGHLGLVRDSDSNMFSIHATGFIRFILVLTDLCPSVMVRNLLANQIMIGIKLINAKSLAGQSPTLCQYPQRPSGFGSARIEPPSKRGMERMTRPLPSIQADIPEFAATNIGRRFSTAAKIALFKWWSKILEPRNQPSLVMLIKRSGGCPLAV